MFHLRRLGDPANGTRPQAVIRAVLPLALGSAFVLASCSLPPRHEYELVPGEAYKPNLQRVLLAPINEAAEVPRGLDKGQQAVFALVREYLKAQGLEVETPQTSAFRRAKNGAEDSAQRESMSLSEDNVLREVGLPDLISGIAERLESNADLVVVPTMVLRRGELRGKSMRWDGVRRSVETTQAMGKWSGTGSGASLHVAVFKADGTPVFSGYGGLDALWRANIRAAKMELIEDRLENERNLREGVCIAFYPYFGKDLSC